MATLSATPKISKGIAVNRTCGGVSIIDLHERKGQIDIVDGYLWPRCDGCAVAVAPAVGRNWAAIRLALGRICSDFRDYPEMVTFIHSIAEVVRMQRRRFQQVLESTMLFRSIAQLLERNEPIVNKPSERIRALLDGRIDFRRDQAVGSYRKTALAPERIQNIVTERVGFAFDDLLTCRTVDMNDLRDSFPPFPVSAAPAGLRPVDYSPQTMRRRHRDYRNVLSESAAHVCKKWSLGSG